jgi:hypothetical protein
VLEGCAAAAPGAAPRPVLCFLHGFGEAAPLRIDQDFGFSYGGNAVFDLGALQPAAALAYRDQRIYSWLLSRQPFLT